MAKLPKGSPMCPRGLEEVCEEKAVLLGGSASVATSPTTWSMFFLNPSFFMGDAVFFSWGILVMCRSLVQCQEKGHCPQRRRKGWQDGQPVDSTMALALNNFPKHLPPHHPW